MSSEEREARRRLWERILAVADHEHRLPLGDETTWDLFPYEASDLRMKPLQPPVDGPLLRAGEERSDCRTCARGLDGALWANERWRLTLPEEAAAVPFVVLEPLQHVDLTGVPQDLAAELGVLIVRLARALEALPGIERAHINKWGDGAAHLHVFGFGRPAGFSQLRGSLLTLWMDSLPAMPDDEWRATGASIARHLSDQHGGRVLDTG